jgi:hypothetical protein
VSIAKLSVRVAICVALIAVALDAISATAPVRGADAVADGSRFGVATHIATRFGLSGRQQRPMDVAAGTGAGWIREEIRWDAIEHPLGQYDWSLVDEMLRESQSRNLHVLGLLGYDNAAQTAGVVDYGIPNIGLWKNFVAHTVARYKGQVHAWEVWNEPDVPYFWKGSVADYVNLLRETYTTIKSIDPTATVMNGGCSNLTLAWFNDFLARGGAQYADVLAFHPYASRSVIDGGNYRGIDLAHLKEIQQRTGKPWWFTEIGWSSASGGPDYGGGVGSERAQASYMVRQYAISLDYDGLDVRHIFWYDFHDDGTDPHSAEQNFGLIRNDWVTTKLSYTAYQTMTAHLGGAVAKGTVDSGAGTAYRYSRDGVIVDVVWGGGRTNLPTSALHAQAYDLGGKAIPADVSGGQIHVDVGGDPIFIEHGEAPAPPSAANRSAQASNPTASDAPSATPPRSATAGLKRYKVANTDGDGANLRDKADASSGLVATLAEGTEVQATGAAVADTSGGSWYPVRAGERTGYIRSDFLSPLG